MSSSSGQPSGQPGRTNGYPSINEFYCDKCDGNRPNLQGLAKSQCTCRTPTAGSSPPESSWDASSPGVESFSSYEPLGSTTDEQQVISPKNVKEQKNRWDLTTHISDLEAMITAAGLFPDSGYHKQSKGNAHASGLTRSKCDVLKDVKIFLSYFVSKGHNEAHKSGNLEGWQQDMMQIAARIRNGTQPSMLNAVREVDCRPRSTQKGSKDYSCAGTHGGPAKAWNECRRERLCSKMKTWLNR